MIPRADHTMSVHLRDEPLTSCRSIDRRKQESLQDHKPVRSGRVYGDINERKAERKCNSDNVIKNDEQDRMRVQ